MAVLELGDVDVPVPSLTSLSGEKLLSAYNNSKAVFTKYYRYKTVSGSNDIDKIGDFVSTLRTTIDLSEEGRRALIMFYALRCGTPDADKYLLDFTLKTCAQGVAYDDDDAGAHIELNIQRGGASRTHQRTEYSEAYALVKGNKILRKACPQLYSLFCPTRVNTTILTRSARRM